MSGETMEVEYTAFNGGVTTRGVLPLREALIVISKRLARPVVPRAPTYPACSDMRAGDNRLTLEVSEDREVVKARCGVCQKPLRLRAHTSSEDVIKAGQRSEPRAAGLRLGAALFWSHYSVLPFVRIPLSQGTNKDCSTGSACPRRCEICDGTGPSSQPKGRTSWRHDRPATPCRAGAVLTVHLHPCR